MNFSKIITVVAAMLLTTASFAQRYNAEEKKHEEYSIQTMTYGNRCWTIDPFGLYSIKRNEFGGGAQAKYFIKGWSFGLEGYYLKNASSMSLFTGYRFTGPKSPIHIDLSLGAGFTQQLQYRKVAKAIEQYIEGTRIEHEIQIDGEFRALEPSAFAELAIEIPLGHRKRCAMGAFARLQYLSREGVVDVGNFDINWATNGVVDIEDIKIDAANITPTPFDYLVGVAFTVRLK